MKPELKYLSVCLGIFLDILDWTMLSRIDSKK